MRIIPQNVYYENTPGSTLVTTRIAVSAINAITITHATTLNTRPLTYLPIKLLSLINLSIVTKMIGNRTPFKVWLASIESAIE